MGQSMLLSTLSFSKNQCRRAFCLALLCGISLFAIPSVQAQPYTSGDSGPKHSYGPDHQGQSSKTPMTGNSGRIDAYGNPVVPIEEDTTPRQRLRNGAYGGHRTEPNVRPLPDLPEQDAGWKF